MTEKLPPEVTTWLRCAEGERLEFKRDCSSAHWKQKLCRTLCAFANDLSGSGEAGVMVIGIEDQTQQLSGFTDAGGSEEQKIRNWLRDWEIAPAPGVSIETLHHASGDVLVIRVTVSPHVCWFEKEAWIRQGSSTRAATVAELDRLMRQRPFVSFDAAPCQRADLNDLALDLFTIYQREIVSAELIAANHRSIEQQLGHQEFFDPHSGHPTNAGLLICGKQPQRFLPMAYVQFVRTAALSLNQREHTLNEKRIDGDLMSQQRVIDAMIDANIVTWSQMQPGRSSYPRISSYPRDALRELLMNALVHRDYAFSSPTRFYWFADRIEILTPGGLLRPAAPDNFPHVSSYRNPVLAAAMHKLGLIEGFGNGVMRVQAMLRENGNPDAVFEFGEHFLKVTIFARQRDPVPAAPVEG